MNAMLGALLLALAAMYFTWAYVQYRRPEPRAWTRSDFLGQVIALVFTGLLAMGVGLVGRFLGNLESEAIGARELYSILGMAVVAALVITSLRRRLTALRHKATVPPPRVVASDLPQPANDVGGPAARGPASAAPPQGGLRSAAYGVDPGG